MRILIVDDTFTNRLFLTELLKRSGYLCDAVDNGRAAIKILNEKSFDIIIMDIEMPIMNGIDTTNHIRNNFEEPISKIPILAMTSHCLDNLPEQLQETEFNGLITKPFTVDKIEKMINEVVYKKLN